MVGYSSAKTGVESSKPDINVKKITTAQGNEDQEFRDAE